MEYPEIRHQNQGVLDLVCRVCQLYPETIAIDAVTSKLSYRQLDEEANRLANTLINSDLGHGAVVAVNVEDRVHLPIYMLGILRAGCVFVPLNPSAPKVRLQSILSELQPDVLILDNSSISDLQKWGSSLRKPCRVINFEQRVGEESFIDWIEPMELSPADAGKSPPDIKVHPDSLCYIYYTSGSTGRPKGIAGRLRGVSHRIGWELNEFEITAGWRVSQLIPSTFDPYLRDTFVPLCSGGTICVPPSPPNLMGPIELLNWIRKERIQLIHTVPSLFSALASAPTRAQDLPDLKLVLLCGEMLHVASVRRWRRRFGKDARLINLYGATEATMFQFFHEVDASDLKRDFIPIGRPTEGDTAVLLDEEGSVCPQGSMGEICIFSPFLSLGYYGQEEITEGDFERLQASENDPPDFYKTGDLAVELEDGNYRLLGRKDSQVKVRGVRVELSEIEAALMEYPLVSGCCVTAYPSSNDRVDLTAYVESPSRDRPGIPELRRHLRDRLLPEMMPTRFVFVAHLPRAENGKIDRAALAERGSSEPFPPSSSASPRNWLEEWFAGIWKELLSLESVGIHDDFLALGGHSLTATQLINCIHTDLGIDLPISAVFEHTTIAQLAHHVMQIKELGDFGKQDPDLKTAEASVSDIAGQACDTIFTKENACLGFDNSGFGEFDCPKQPSPHFGRRKCNLIMVIDDRMEFESFKRLGAEVARWDPRIQVSLHPDRPGMETVSSGGPNLIFGPCVIRHFNGCRGRQCCGAPLSKSEENRALATNGISVPSWVLWTEHQRPDLSNLGDYVITKPDYGAKGAEVRIVRRQRVRWRPTMTAAAGLSEAMIVQRFIYTGRWPVSYRVNTLFGRVLYAVRMEGRTDRGALMGPTDFRSAKRQQAVSVISNNRDSSMSLCFDKEIIHLGERAHEAFPDIPLLSTDILREQPSGRLYVLEVNSLGYNWNFTSRERKEWQIDIESQFDGVRKAAYILAEKTQQLAC